MKKLFVEYKYNKKVKLDNSVIKKLPEKICLCSSVQYIDSLKEIKKQLEQDNKKVILFEGKKAKYPGQILGCNIEKIKQEVDVFLYIGDGLFHPKSLLFENNKTVFSYNPHSKKLTKLTEKDIETIKKMQKIGLIKFYSSKNIGILISTKNGQNREKDALKFKKQWESKKNIFLFLVDSLDFSELENFNYIDCWVNSMCPRLALTDSKRTKKAIVNIDNI